MLNNLKPGATIHLMGVCGTAMASLAGLLQDMGFKITGSDQNVYPPMSTMLEGLGIKVMEGYKAENLSHKPDFVIVGNVISKSNLEAQALLSSNTPYTSLPKAMGELVIADRQSIVGEVFHSITANLLKGQREITLLLRGMSTTPLFLIKSLSLFTISLSM